MGTVFDLLGKVDNLHDPEPTLNRRSAVLGVVISVLVRTTGAPAMDTSVSVYI